MDIGEQVVQQVLQDHARKIAKTYTTDDRKDWRQAATDLRQPYWDWAANPVPPDEVLTLTKVTITISDGTTKEVDNPLYHYKFNPIDASFYDPYQQWQTTLRQPKYTSDDIEDATDDPQRVKEYAPSYCFAETPRLSLSLY